MSIGDFAVRLAAALGTGATSREGAVTALRAAGVSIGDDLDARLTDGTAARFLADLGVKVVEPRNPDHLVSAAMAEGIAARAGLTTSISTAAATTPPPTQCLQLNGHGACVSCCVHAGFSGSACSKFCKANQPPPPSESQP